jgi:hypothetical protein
MLVFRTVTGDASRYGVAADKLVKPGPPVGLDRFQARGTPADRSAARSYDAEQRGR